MQTPVCIRFLFLWFFRAVAHGFSQHALRQSFKTLWNIFVSCCITDICNVQKYKAYILKYKALILK